ncbi:MAG: FeoB-associated Cys-rich membrane protein [Deltaproteobacteria bacterium]|jgi:hypothetical protein|nr:MAG: FeoB-associated Cys-rich membrane protein [Deltaproteobacteria bacterium]
MEATLIFIIVGLASAYLVRKFYRSLQKNDETQCGCGCTSCPEELDCEEPSPKAIHHIN